MSKNQLIHLREFETETVFDIRHLVTQLSGSTLLFSGEVHSVDWAILWIDAQNGIDQTAKHYLHVASILQIPHLIVAVNQIEKNDASETTFNRIKTSIEALASVNQVQSIHFIPISKQTGNNIISSATNTPWYAEQTLLELIVTYSRLKLQKETPVRFPVQSVIEQPNEFSSYTGVVSGGSFQVDDTVLALPSNRIAKIKSIRHEIHVIDHNQATKTVAIQLDGNIPIVRGDMLVKLNVQYPRYSSSVLLWVHWLASKPLHVGKKFKIKHTTYETKGFTQNIIQKFDTELFRDSFHDKNIQQNDWSLIQIKTQKPLKFDAYSENRITGSLVLIDENTQEVIANGIIIPEPEIFSYNI